MGAVCGKNVSEGGISLGNGMHDGGEMGGESQRIKDREKAAARKKAQDRKAKEDGKRKDSTSGTKARRGSLTDNLQRCHAASPPRL